MKNQKLTLAYFGSPSFSALLLENLLFDYSINRIIEIKFVVTQPDQPVGRKQILTPTPVKQIAEKYRIPIYYSENSKFKAPNSKQKNKILNPNDQNCKAIENWKLKIENLDLCLVYAHSMIIPKDWLNLPRLGFWCVHPSLLPKYRGPSPIAYPLIFGDKKTGVTIFQMDEKIDHGPIIAQE
ncbi:MAG: methionyl-tRNA formyltransferase, partial [Patescibacteria group bacterium]|nr:methionyl-tRNA formyltransferase [Patescibacteria group bacterium]